MKVTARGEYACLAMLDLAKGYYQKELVSIKTIAAQHRIPEPYLVQILMQLQKAGLVASKRGAQGGYYLSLAPEQISLGAVIRAVEGPLAISKCLETEAFAQESKQANCIFRQIWNDAQKAVENIIDNVTFADILARQKSLEEKHAKI